MSIRTLVELNHDSSPGRWGCTSQQWADSIAAYMRGCDREMLPRGVPYKAHYHHSYPVPPRGGLLVKALSDVLAPLLADARTAGADGRPRVGRAARKKADVLAQAALAVFRNVEP